MPLSSRAVEEYWRRFSAPLLDRIDIRVALSNAGSGQPLGTQNTEHCTASLRKGIGRATAVQRKRQGKPNAYLEAAEIRILCPLDGESEVLLNDSARRFGFSSRGIHSCVKLARTIADLEERSAIEKKDVEEAVLLHRNAGGIHLMF